MIQDPKLKKKIKSMTKKYDKDYFDEHTMNLIEGCVMLIESIENGSFEYDTGDTDFILYLIRSSANKINI